MEYDPKQLVDLLQEYKSDETRKARRNVSIIAFVIISAALLHVDLSEVSVLGMNLHAASSLTLLLVAAGLLMYWVIVFLITWSQDREIQKERSGIRDSTMKQAFERLRTLDDYMAKHGGQFVAPDNRAVRDWCAAYTAQKERTARATKLGRAIRSLEILVPLALVLVAIGVLAYGIVAAVRA